MSSRSLTSYIPLLHKKVTSALELIFQTVFSLFKHSR